jgi:regulator of nonsense transcripts 3
MAHGVTFFNLGHRHANRRGPPRGLKETETSASVWSEGKTSKRCTASYGAHEVG